MDLSTNLAGISLEHPIMNGGGTCKRLDGEEGVEGFLRTMISAIVVGSITVEPRTGNSGNAYFYCEPFSLNSLGMPNPGVEYWRQNLPEAVRRCHDVNKALIINVAGFNVEDYLLLTEMAVEGGADIVEWNFGCPNIIDGGIQKDIFSFDFELMNEVAEKAEAKVGSDVRVAVKVSPYSNPADIKRVATVCKLHRIVKVLVTTNTFPNGFGFRYPEAPAITPNKGLAGTAGPCLKPIGLGQVVQFKRELEPCMDVVGVGGINSGRDVLHYRMAGATACQVVTAYMERGKSIFNTILDEYISHVTQA